MNEETHVPDNTRTFVVGTAGHVDHGKSTLVRRLTGIDPDRLQEEKAREMTIDLGFAWLDLAEDISVSIIDVPGHERFIKNMLAGVGGLDAALLIVAADEGPMPQTTEHLAILDLLGIEHGIIVVTKSDLVDSDWLDLVVEETREALHGTTLAGAPIIPVSANTGSGIPELLLELERLLRELEADDRSGKPRLPVDRVFSVAGFGTVVTGTLLGGPLRTGDELELLPSMLRARVRGLQTHARKTSVAFPGSRTAINLTGVDRELVQRGDVITVPGWLKPTTIIDARLRLIPGAPQPLVQNDPVDLFVGASESPAHVTLLDADEIAPGGEGWVQIRLDREVVVVEGDQFIVRQASPSVTIGGGKVLNPHPRRHRRFRSDVIADLQTRSTGTLEDRILQALADGPLDIQQVAEAAGTDASEVGSRINEFVENGRIVQIGGASSRYVGRDEDVRRYSQDIATILQRFHQQYPLRAGMPREDVRSRSGLPARLFDALVQHLTVSGDVEDRGNQLASPGHVVKFDGQQQTLVDAYLRALNEQSVAPPAASSFNIDAELLGAMAAQGLVVRMADNVVYSTDALARIKEETLGLIDQRGELTLAEFRDHFGSSRKYAQAVLEYFDQTRVTRRVGDVRVRGSG